MTPRDITVCSGWKDWYFSLWKLQQNSDWYCWFFVCVCIFVFFFVFFWTKKFLKYRIKMSASHILRSGPKMSCIKDRFLTQSNPCHAKAVTSTSVPGKTLLPSYRLLSWQLYSSHALFATTLGQNKKKKKNNLTKWLDEKKKSNPQ